MLSAMELRNSIENALPTLPRIPLSKLHPTVHHYPTPVDKLDPPTGDFFSSRLNHRRGNCANSGASQIFTPASNNTTGLSYVKYIVAQRPTKTFSSKRLGA